jgi:hypothetical protein
MIIGRTPMVTSDQWVEIVDAVKDRVAEVLGDLKDDKKELNEILDRAGVSNTVANEGAVKDAIEKAIAAVDGDAF